MSLQTLYEKFHYEIAPPLMLISTNVIANVVSFYGTTLKNITWSLLGNSYSWKIVGLFILWSISSLWVPSKEFIHRASPSGLGQVYKANGLQYFTVTLVSFSAILYTYPQLAVDITENFPQIIATCNIIALVLCIYLYHKGKSFSEVSEKHEKRSAIYEFYVGVETHPTIFKVDVKQLIISRFGVASFFLLVMVFSLAHYKFKGFNFAHSISAILAIVYCGKHFWWETGYLSLFDVNYDRAGYYLLWGSLVWVPSLFTLPWYHVVDQSILISNNCGILILIFGLIVMILTYRVDWEKEYVRQNGGRCRLWLKPATYVTASYKTENGATKKSLLVSCGFWGLARHLNYTFEVLSGLSWTLVFMGFGVWVYLYVIFETCFMIHRVFRDERKCAAKYGVHWEEYCKKVPYRLVPGIF